MRHLKQATESSGSFSNYCLPVRPISLLTITSKTGWWTADMLT